jgi:casein kinase 1
LKIAAHEDRYRMIYKKKRDTKPEDLCAGFHKNLTRFIEYCRNLAFEKEPDYNYLIGLLSEAIDNQLLKVDFDFDWNKDNNSFHTNGQKNNDLDTSNISNFKNKNSNSGYSSLINKNEISHDLKMIMIEETNSINKYNEEEKANKANIKDINASPKKQYKTNGTKLNDLEADVNQKPRSKSHSTKKKEEIILKKEPEKKERNLKEIEKKPEKKNENNNDTSTKKEEDNSICSFI